MEMMPKRGIVLIHPKDFKKPSKSTQSSGQGLSGGLGGGKGKSKKKKRKKRKRNIYKGGTFSRRYDPDEHLEPWML